MKIVKKNMKIIIFTAVKNRCILHGRVFVMPLTTLVAPIEMIVPYEKNHCKSKISGTFFKMINHLKKENYFLYVTHVTNQVKPIQTGQFKKGKRIKG